MKKIKNRILSIIYTILLGTVSGDTSFMGNNEY